MTTLPKSQPTLVSASPRFLVEDVEQALTFYNRLGFQVMYQDEGFAIIHRDGVDLQFNVSDGPMTGGGVCWIEVTNIEALYQDYLPTIVIRSPLTDQSWGKEFFVQDPFRNLVLFGEYTAEADGQGVQTT